jgi:hypothetical protein
MTTERESANRPEPWEEQLRLGLDALSDHQREEPPNVADLQMLVAHVQQQQHRQLLWDLCWFWTCALLLLTGGIYLFARRPAYFVTLQAVAAAALVAAGAVYLSRERRRVTE